MKMRQPASAVASKVVKKGSHQPAQKIEQSKQHKHMHHFFISPCKFALVILSQAHFFDAFREGSCIEKCVCRE